MAQEPALPHHLRCHLSCCSLREDAFARVVAHPRLLALILVAAVDRQLNRHYFAMLQERVGELSLSQNVCA